MIEGREAIPVRAIPLLTDWHFMSPDVAAQVLAGDGDASLLVSGRLQAHRLEGGRVRPIPERWWGSWSVRSLQALSERIDATAPTYNVGYQQWRAESLSKLPPGAFIWKKEFVEFHAQNWRAQAEPHERAESAEDAQDADAEEVANERAELEAAHGRARASLEEWRELEFSPLIEADLLALVMEGFEFRASNSSPAPAKAERDDDSLEAPKRLDPPLPLTTSEVAFCFAGLPWDEEKWKKPLGDKRKWLRECIAIPGRPGVSETHWNPVLIGAALVKKAVKGGETARYVRGRFQSKPALKPWLAAWNAYEAEYLDSD